MSMGVSGIGNLLGGMGNILGQGQQAGLQQQGPNNGEMLKKLLEMLMGGDGAQRTAGAGESDMQKLRQMMTGQQGLQAMMPGHDSGRSLNFG
ncbi:hypothetical protein [Pseudomonas mucidolens]|uniref:Uncharacterized protein n=1 Tax=Pseudomonas mucidolens TaxID=46679 RepID=A0A1H2ND20_9PSED|nr:hypothetical protein [Pseudomonas mucidolens]SDV03274.1 hypothetical protein SAMN05216202_3460 [Pseudomonas mucidolens]SQH32193.1 Uncharacterised protein [Pseudomonas mucidolens]